MFYERKSKIQSRLESVWLNMSSLRFWIVLVMLALWLTACKPQYPETCPSSTPIGLTSASEIADDDSLPFRFPLDESPIDKNLYFHKCFYLQ